MGKTTKATLAACEQLYKGLLDGGYEDDDGEPVLLLQLEAIRPMFDDARFEHEERERMCAFYGGTKHNHDSCLWCQLPEAWRRWAETGS